MNNPVTKLMSQSANDFSKIVWPIASKLPLIGGGDIKPVEAVATNDFKDELDVLAGIDAWQIDPGTPMLRGLASRVQWNAQHNTFSIRLSLPSGQLTEFEKRRFSIANKEYGYLFPHITVQAYLDKHGGNLLSCAAITTENLFEAASRLVDGIALQRNRNPTLYGVRTLPCGTKFLYMSWNYLCHLNKLDTKNIYMADS